MSALRETVKRFVPQRMRDGLRYVTDTRYRRSILEGQARQSHLAEVNALVRQSADALWSATDGRIASGPFKGLRYIRDSMGSAWAPKLLGTYVLELAAVIEEIVARAPACIVDIGAAEGYYAVGLASRLPSACVVAFEAVESGHHLLTDFASANGVESRVQVRGLCTRVLLDESLRDGGGAVVICDVEGAEVELLDPATSPALRHTDVLVEVHPWGHEQMAEVLRQRFEPTHSITEISTRPRTTDDLPPVPCSLIDHSILASMDEMRPCPMSWLWMTVR